MVVLARHHRRKPRCAQVSDRSRSALGSLRKIEEFGKRRTVSVTRSTYGRNDGVHQILRGDDFVRDQIAHNVIRLQQVMLRNSV